MKFLKPTPKNLRTLSVNTTALTDFFLSGFSAFLFFGVFAVSGFFGGPFLRGMKTTKKRQNSKQNNKQQKRKKDHKMQTRRPHSLVTKKATQKQNNTNEFFEMERNNTRQTNKNKNIKT